MSSGRGWVFDFHMSRTERAIEYAKADMSPDDFKEFCEMLRKYVNQSDATPKTESD